MEKLLQECSDVTGYKKQMVDDVIKTFLEEVVDELSQGHAVDLGKEFGVFGVKLRESHLAENSPRTPKDSRYKVFFREGKDMKKRLKVSKETK